MMELWNNGIMGEKNVNDFPVSIIPIFQYSMSHAEF
jgi:hypothetical protein